MIILYEYTETAFTNNGLGCLNDATSCVVKETLNSEYELEMEYPVNGIHYSDIQLRRIILAKPNSYDQAQPFRIYSISKPIGGIVTVNAEHISYDMSGLPVRGALENYAWYVNDVFEHIRNNSVYPCPFTFSSDITEEKKSINLSEPRSVKAFLGTDDGLLSLFGGEWEFDRYSAILHKKRGQNRGVSIEYGKNLTDVTQDEACSEMYTAVYPYYYQEDDGLQKLDDDVVKILDTPYNNVYVLDLSSEFDEMPTQDQLREKAQEYINDNKLGEPKVSLKVSFIKNPEVIEALHDVRLGDTVSVKFIKIGVDTTSRCISYEFNVITEQYNYIELGEPTKTIVDTMASTNSAIIDTQDNLDDEIDRATGVEETLNTRIDKTDSDITLEVTRAKGAEESLGSSITLTEESITAEVERAQLAEGQLNASLSLKLGRDENNQVVSMINASADQIKLLGNRLIVECNNFELDSDGRVHIIDSLLFDSGDATGVEILGHDTKHKAILKNVNLDIESVTTPDGFTLATVDDIGNFAEKGSDLCYGLDSSYSGYLVVTKNIKRIAISNGDLYIRYKGSNGDVVVSISASSDIKLKHDIYDSEINAINKIMKIVHREFYWNDSNRFQDNGYIAQELKLIDPSMVISSMDDDGTEWLSVNTVYMISICTKAIQEQQKEIEALKLENAQIKGELDILKQRLERMEEKIC